MSNYIKHWTEYYLLFSLATIARPIVVAAATITTMVSTVRENRGLLIIFLVIASPFDPLSVVATAGISVTGILFYFWQMLLYLKYF